MARRPELSPGRVEALASAGVFLLALIPRLLHIREIRLAGLADFLRLDPLYYQEWALRILGGQWLDSHVFEMSPLYPYSLAALYKITGVSLLAPRLVQAVLGAATCSLLLLLGSRLFGLGAGIVAGIGLAWYGPGIFYDGQINKTTLAMALTLCFCGALWRSRGRGSGWIACGGFLLGLTALVHENVNVAAPFLLAWILMDGKAAPWRARLRRSGLFVAGYALAVLPATAHNIAGAGEFVLITSAGGENFYTGNNEHASGRYAPPPFVRPDPFYEHEDFRREAARRAGRELTRREASTFWWMEGLRFVAGNPGRFLRLIWDKVDVFLNDFERPDNFSYYNFKAFSPTLALPWLTFGVVLPLGLLGLAVSAGRWRELFPFHAAMGAYAATALIFFIQSRYRMPALPLLFLFAGHGLVWLQHQVIRRRWKPSLAAAALLASAGLFTFKDPGNGPAFHAQNDAILGELLVQAGRNEEAITAFGRSLQSLAPVAKSGNPTIVRIVGAANYGLGMARLESGDSIGAARAFREASACPDPDIRLDALARLAEIYEKAGRTDLLAAVLADWNAAAPGDLRTAVRYGEALYKLGRLREAETAVRLALDNAGRTRPLDEADAWYGLALIRRGLGDEAGAAAALEKVIALNPRHPRAGWIREQIPPGAAAPESK